MLGLIEAGDYAAVLDKIQTDLLPKTNGCAESGAPDNNDWVQDCGSQAELYPALIQLANTLQSLM